jgi:hypothetical protein
MTDGELPQIQTATEPANLERASQENVALGKGSESLFHLNSACDKEKVHPTVKALASKLKSGEKAFPVDKRVLKALQEAYAEAKKKWLPSSTNRRQKRSLTRSGHAVCLSCASESTLPVQRKNKRRPSAT